ncbi:MAG: prepilin-type N-terminal cleavage/methylation domain-containing protein [bacterium]|nr:prepilin-type N-terminal cleavage/methylation domain-containing protein [bacterium]
MRGQHGFTLVELLVAALILGIAIIPLLQVIPGTLAPAQVTETDMRLGAAATRKTEEIIGRLRADVNSVTSGAEACADLPNCRLQWTIAVELSSAAPGVGSLRTIATTACRDANANSACDADEAQVRYDTKVTSRP